MTPTQQLREQNTGQAWIDCTLRRRPRPHHYVRVILSTGTVVDRCVRCPVSTYRGGAK